MATGFNTQVGSGEYRLQFETDNKEHYLLMQETARRCVDGKIKTNADRIRAMSDEKLAKMFMDFSEKLLNECGVVAEAKTTEYVLEWLKQPAEK